MTSLLTSGPVAVRGSRLSPITKIVAMLVLSLPVLVTGNPRVAAVLVVGEVLAFPALGLGPRTLARYAWPFVLALGGVWLANYFASRNLSLLLPLTARLVSLALPGLMLVLTTEPVDLADALVQRWRVPARFAYGALAAFRLLPLLGQDWTSLRRARRARGMDAGYNPVRAVTLGVGLLFALLVCAIRRGVRLAVAMQARGFGMQSSTGMQSKRSFARLSRIRWIDWATMAAACVLAALALIVGSR